MRKDLARAKQALDEAVELIENYIDSFSIKTYGLFKLVKEYKIDIKKTTNRTEFAKAFPKVDLLRKVGANTYNRY